MLATCPAGVSAPVAESIRKVTMVSVSWFAASTNAPLGSMLKLRGVLPWVDSCPNGFSRPDDWSMAKMAMVSWPRLEP